MDLIFKAKDSQFIKTSKSTSSKVAWPFPVSAKNNTNPKTKSNLFPMMEHVEN